MSPYVASLLLFTLGLGTSTTFASSHWLLAWMGLEINTLAILPLMSQAHHPRSVEATTKYFLTQATAAATLLFAATTNAWLTGHWDITLETHPVSATLVILALSLKLGLAPFHTWLPEVMQGLSIPTALLLSTWQKLAPFSILIQLPTTSSHQTLIVSLALASVLIGGWGGLNQTQLRKILAYSSVAHLGWMILVLQFSTSITMIALTTYLTITSTAFLTLHLTTTTTINGLATSSTKAPIVTTLFPLVLLSLGGLPPLTGFLPKWAILQQLTQEALPLVATFAALGALLSLYFYLRLSYAMTLTLSPNNITATPPWRLTSPYPSAPLAQVTISSLLLLPAAPTISCLLML